MVLCVHLSPSMMAQLIKISLLINSPYLCVGASGVNSVLRARLMLGKANLCDNGVVQVPPRVSESVT